MQLLALSKYTAVPLYSIGNAQSLEEKENEQGRLKFFAIILISLARSSVINLIIFRKIFGGSGYYELLEVRT